MAEPVLEMQGIQKRFAGIPALADASLRIEQAEVHALMGQNGAGKSTLIKALTGYVRKDAGEAQFLGAPFEVASPHEAQQRGISTIYQEINLVPLRSGHVGLAGDVRRGVDPSRPLQYRH
jgi:monosaccharide-transporting ATPase